MPLDDHVADPRYYDLMTDYLLDAAGLLPAVERA